MMPALPGPHLVRIHPRLTFASFEAGFNANTGFDDPRQLRQRWLLQLRRVCLRWGEVLAITLAGVLIAGLARGLCLQHPVVREGTTGDHQPLLWPRAFAFEARRHAALD